MKLPRRIYIASVLSFLSQQTLAAENSAITPGIGFLQIAGALLFVLFLMFIAAWLLKRFGPVAAGNKIVVKVVGGVSIGNRERVLVVEIDDQWLILGVTPNNINHLGSMPKKDMPQHSDPATGGMFQEWMKRTVEKRNNAPKS